METHNLKVGNGEIGVVLNKFAKQADSALMINYNDTHVLVTVVSKEAKDDVDFFPLVINFEEKLYASGKIPGNYQRRESRPSTQATLSARLIDRPIRPLFPEGYVDEVQVVCSVMSYDENYEPDILAITGASLALNLAPTIPFTTPVAGVCVGMIDNQFIINPTQSQKEESKLELKMAGTKEAITMVESQSEELDEKTMIEALMFGHEEIKRIIAWQEEVIASQNVEKQEFVYTPKESLVYITNEVRNNFSQAIRDALQTKEKQVRNQALDVVKEEISTKYESMLETYEIDENEYLKLVNQAFSEIEKDVFRRLIIDDKYRVDGRDTTEIRPLSSEIDLLPRTHGSSLFTRGETQSLATVTLGVKSDEQTFDGLEPYTEKPFMLHYNFPPYSVGETGRMGAPGRREIGHGHLGEMALEQVVPDRSKFPYTIRVVSEILESNGSSSQATICAGSLALMAAGVPIKEHVAGIAMGLIKDDAGFTILTDIQGLEDHLGDMDFKVAGTKDGITALQMDIKIQGITEQILTQALEQARVARLEIIDHMNTIIDKPRKNLSVYAPKTKSLTIPVEKIKDVIGKGGETINKIIDATDVKIDIEEDGQVFIYGVDQEKIDLAYLMIEKIVKEYKVGEQYLAKVTRIEKYGAFVKFEDQEALLHISLISDKRIDKVEDELSLNQEIVVEITEIDDKKLIKVKLIKKVDGE